MAVTEGAERSPIFQTLVMDATEGGELSLNILVISVTLPVYGVYGEWARV